MYRDIMSTDIDMDMDMDVYGIIDKDIDVYKNVDLCSRKIRKTQKWLVSVVVVKMTVGNEKSWVVI